MNRKVSIFTLQVFLLAILVVPFYSAHEVSAVASIDFVDHQVKVLYSGHLIISDAISVSGGSVNDFLIGVPYQYGPYILKVLAYDETETLTVTSNVQLDGRSGFYGARINFKDSIPEVFTVVFVLSNDLVNQTSSGFAVDFPAYPSFVDEVAKCEVSVLLPEVSTNITLTTEDGVQNSTTLSRENLEAFTAFSASVSFDLPAGLIRLVKIEELNREIQVDPSGGIAELDTYRITNNSTENIEFFELALPMAASKIKVKDLFGRALAFSELSNNNTLNLINATLILPLKPEESTIMIASFDIPRIRSKQTGKFDLEIDLFYPMKYYIDKVTVTVIPPEGAQISISDITANTPSYVLSRSTYQDLISLSINGVAYWGEIVRLANVFQVVYEYNPLWISFRPTLWISVLVAIGSAVLLLQRRPKVKVPQRISVLRIPVGLSQYKLRALVASYKEKNLISSNLKSLETRAKKGKIPRRRYKVKRKTMEIKLRALSEKANELRETLRSAGGEFKNLISQLEVAERRIDEVEMKIADIEARQKRGDLSLEMYRKLLNDYKQRKETADTRISGILLRILEEIQ